MRPFSRVAPCALTVLLLAIPCTPQSTAYGRLTGAVKDPQGGVLPGVSVTLYGEAVLGEPTVVTEVDGSYLFRALNPGVYGLRFELQGFSTFIREGVVVTTGNTVTINATLELAGVAESLIVIGNRPRWTSRPPGWGPPSIRLPFTTCRAAR